MHYSEKKQRATIHRMRSTLAAIPNSCKTVSHNILLIGLFGTLIGGVQDTWATCSTVGSVVTCSGVPSLPLFLNNYASSTDGLTVNVTPTSFSTQMNAQLGGQVISLTGQNYTLNNSGLIDPALLGLVSVLSGGAFIGTGSVSTVNVLNNAAGIIKGTGILLGTDLASINGLALSINNAAAGSSTVTNNGTVTSSGLSSGGATTLADTPVVAVYGGSTVNFTNSSSGVINGRVAFETSAAGNTFTNAGAITGGVSLGANSVNNTFIAITGSSIDIGDGVGGALGGLSGVNITFAPTGTVDGGTGVLVLQNPAGVGTTGVGTASSATYTTFSNLIVNSGTWTLQGPLVTGSSTLNGGVAGFNNNATFGSGVLTSNGGILQANNAGLNVANPITLGAGGLTVQGTNAFTLSGIISGAGGLTKSGAGSLTLSGVNTYLGATTIAAGTVVVSNNSSFSTSAITITGASTISAPAAITLNNLITLNANGTFTGVGSLTLSSTISGAGGIIKTGTGTLSLTGNNTTYTGTTALNAGTLIVGSNTALGSGILSAAGGTTLSSSTAVTLINNINLNGNLTIGGSNSLTLNGIIGGTGGLSKLNGGDLTLNGANVNGGNTALSSGTLIVGSNTALGNGALNAANGTSLDSNTAVSLNNAASLAGALTIVGSNDLTLNGVISGAGSFVKNGTATLTLNGANNYLGGTILNAGTLVAGSNTALGSGGLTVGGASTLDSSAVVSLTNSMILNAQLTIAGTNDLTLNGIISGGTGSLKKMGNTTLTLNGVNTYGSTELNAGTLLIPTNSAIGSGRLTVSGASTFDSTSALSVGNLITLNSVLTTPGNFDLSLDGVIDGSGGGFIKNGATTLTLNGNNTYSGTTTINGGTLFAGHSNALGTSTLIVGNASTLDSVTGVSLSNLITLNADLTTAGTNALTLDGVISGAGGLIKNGTSKLTLDGINTYTGLTTLNGGSLIIGSDAAHSSATIVSNLGINSGITLGGHGTVGGTVTVNSSGHLAPGNSIGTLTVGGDLTLNAGSILDFEFAGSGVGDRVKVLGNLSLNGATLNVIDLGGFALGTYNLFDYNGTLTQSGGGIVFGTTPPGGTYSIEYLTGSKLVNLINSTGVTLNFWNANGLASPTQRGGGSGTWSTTSPVWTDSIGSLTAAMSPQPGFAVFGGAPGTVTVDNTSGQTSALGMQFEVGGYILDGAGLELNNGANPAIIRVSNSSSNTATINNVLFGTGGIDKQDIGTLVLNGANTYTGTTLVSAGTLSISNDNNLGAVGNALDIRGSTLQTTANVTMNRATTLGAAGGTFLTDSGTTLTQSGAISGPGALTKNGAGTFILNNGTNSYTGGTTVNAGTLQAGVAGALVNNTAYAINGGLLDLNNFDLVMSSLTGTGGSINLGTATLTDNQTSNSSYAGSFLGSNLFVKQGVGSLILTGNSSAFAGTAQIDAGLLQVNGTLGGNLLVNAGGRLEGTGTVGNTTVFGTISPGTGGLQTLKVNGNYIQNAGSLYEAKINAAGQSTLIQISGNAQLNGGNVNVTAANGLYTLGHYTLLNAGGNVTGTYTQMTNNLPFLTFALLYDTHNVFLDIIPSTVITFPDVAVTPNQQAVAVAVESLGTDNLLFETVLNLPTIQSAQNAFNSLSGEVYAATIGSLIDASRYVEDAMLTRMTTSTINNDTAHKAYNIWAQGIGSWGHRDGNINSARVITSGGGIFMGADTNSDAGRFGFLAGYSALQTNVEARSSNTNSDSYHLGLYADQRFGNFNLRTGGAYSWHDLDSRRIVVFPGLSELLKSDYMANTAQAFVESGYGFERGTWLAEPFARASAIHVGSDSFHENNGIAALTSRGNTENVYYSTLGGRIYNTFKQEENFVLKGRGLLGWRHAFNNINPLATMMFDTSIPFTIGGSPIARDGVVIDAGMDALLPNKALTLTLSYSGQLASQVQDHGVRGVISWRFS
ncbi:MAG: autotransporter domain-containing protein [Legionella sp.]|nr:autotransporter domain-containing protein [Legionella sp.]